MRFIAVLLFPAICMSSCFPLRASRTMYSSQPNAAPFVVLQNKEKLQPKEVHEKQDSIVADQKVFAKMDVALYCDGSTTFANICHPCNSPFEYKFAPKIVAGDLNIYKATWKPINNTGRGRYIPTTRDFIQQTDSGSLHEYWYYNVERMILPGTPGYEYLVKYRRRALFGTLGIFGSIGVTVAGIGILNATHHSLVQAAGDVTILTGSLGYFASIISLSGIKESFVNKAVAKHNELLDR